MAAMQETRTRDELSDQAWSDYNDVLDTVIERDTVYILGASGDDDEVHAPAGRPFLLQVVETQEDEVIRWLGEGSRNLDPTWAVQPACGETRLDVTRNYWVYGPEYSLTPTKES